MTDTINKKIFIDSIKDGQRLSTQELLQEIYEKIDAGYTQFDINACGQHNIGGSLWSDNGQLIFNVKNPGQRVGSMAMDGTKIIIEGSAPADIGWLNSGGEIIVKGDGGDTTAHCAASGVIYVAGRVGTRSGALMKHDPKFEAPEFWVLENAGSFSFEFMGGGVGVICGLGCENLESVLGSRSCVGMVGGTVYVRGPVADLSDDVHFLDLDARDMDFLQRGLKIFLAKVEREDVYEQLVDFSSWKKIVAKTYEERKKKAFSPIKDFRLQKWVPGGIFGDLIKDDYKVSKFAQTADARLRIPSWNNYRCIAPCEFNCPIGIPTQRRISAIRQGKLKEALNMVLDYSPFPASVCGQVCPNLCMEECNRQYVDKPLKVAELGLLSSNTEYTMPEVSKKQKVAIIGSGVSGLTAAWHLKKEGYNVCVYEKDKEIGGKLKQVIPPDRLNQETLEAEIQRVKKAGIEFKTDLDITAKEFKKLEKKYDALIIAIGAHNPIVLPFEGKEKLVKGLDFLKEINNGNKPEVGEKVVVIGAGNAGMDVVIGAYNMGAKEVSAIDIQKPAAFNKEIEHVEKLGANIMWPCFTKKITDEGVLLTDGTLIEADSVIISIGDRPEFTFLQEENLTDDGKVKINEYLQTEFNQKVFVAGDAIKLGLFTNAMGDGRNAAINVDNFLQGKPMSTFEKTPMIPRDRVRTEYYPGIDQVQLQSSSIEEDTDRCLSCGYCRDCEICKNACPQRAIERVVNENGTAEYVCDDEKCIGCGICAGVCPCGIWVLEDNFNRVKEA